MEPRERRAKTKIANWKAWTEITKNLVEIIAFIVAAGWAVWRFDVLEKPSIEPRAALDSSIRWAPMPLTGPHSACLAGC